MPNTNSTTNKTQPGYFRIGHVVLQIPPTDITCNRVVNDDQMSTLRGQSPMFIKTGQARWDVTVRWKAVKFENADGSFVYSQWDDLRSVVAIFKIAPFVEVENLFLRQHFTNIQQQYETQRMAFALKQLRVDTNPDSNNVLDVVLTMSLFNYAPYTTDFGYIGSVNSSGVNADQSIIFQNYISNWIALNMDNHPGTSTPPIQAWESQDDGTVTFKWRQYIYIPFNSTLPPGVSNASAGYTPVTPIPKISKGSQNAKLSTNWNGQNLQQIVNNAAAAAGIDPAIATSLCLYESGGNPLSGRGRSDKGGLGLFQLVQSTASGLGVTNVFDPTQNATAGCQYLAQQLKRFGNYTLALGAYNAGPAWIIAYSKGISQDHGTINPQKIKTANGLPPAGVGPNNGTTVKYVTTILSNAGKANLIVQTPALSQNGTPPPTPTSTASSLDVPDAGYLGLMNAANQAASQLEGQWYWDHSTEKGSVFYKENETRFAGVDAPTSGDYSMFPNQMSVVMVNNLPTIPLAAMQYPTYQHVGPSDSMISISFNSVGRIDTNLSEPEHEGIEALSAMSSQLEDQFHSLRTVFRAVSSVHRTQAIFVENQVLNLLGIQGAMIRGLNTETVPDAVDLAQVSILLSQYENVFEETPPWSMNGVAGTYSTNIKTLMTSGQLSTLSPEEKAAYNKVQAFATAWTNLDQAYLLDAILSISEQPQNFLGDVTDTPDTNIFNTQRTNLLGALDLSTTSEEPPVVLEFSGTTITSRTQSDIYPGLQIRRQALQNTSQPITYADFFVFSQLPLLVNDAEIAAIKQQLQAQYASQLKDIIGVMYNHLFDYTILTDPLFSNQASSITRSPKFQSQFAGSLSVSGPSSQAENKGHFCYKDLGLTDYAQTPTSYLVDHNQQLQSDTANRITQLMGTANQTANAVDEAQGVTTAASATPQSSSEFTTQSWPGASQGLPGSASALIRMMNVPGYSMDSAFPTYKLFLMEECNTGPFFAFDNFYSYASVLDIEIIKYRDKPDTAIIQISNLSHLLQHRLYDHTAAGKLEKEADKFNVAPDGGLIAGPGGALEPGVNGNPTSGLDIIKVADGSLWQKVPRKYMVEGIGETYSRIPSKFFALQTGSKIQIRMGFSNNPDNLYPVFTGQVTSIEGDDILTITCQSFMLELMNVPGTAVKKNSLLGFNFLTGGAAFGGFSLTNSGDTVNVMKTMLSSPAARHFGHWQIGPQVIDPLLKGFQWTEIIGSALASASNQTISNIGSLLQTGFDRSGDNILVNSIINFDASKTQQTATTAGTRNWFTSNPNLFLGTAQYSIPKQSTLSVWDILKDVSRRYPDYNLMVRDYGYPYESDATLVYAHPLDWYYRRPLLFGEAETEKPNNTTQGQLFTQWWSTTGSKAWENAFKQADPNFTVNPFTIAQETANLPLYAMLALAKTPTSQLAGKGPEEFEQAAKYMHEVLSGEVAPDIPLLYSLTAQISTYGNIGGGLAQSIDANFQALYREWLTYLTLSEPASNSSRLKPVRQYHLIDSNHIVHNGISINDQMFNAVKVKDRAPLKFNQNIPDQHTRVLDVTEMINDPDKNALQGFGDPLLNSYAQSFLREEVGKMYQGELIIRGTPEIEPFDVILLSDASTGTVGPIEVESVIHTFNIENGYITIIKPRLLVLANEAVSLGVIQNLSFAWTNASANLVGLGHLFNPFDPNFTTAAGLVEAGIGAGAILAGAAAFAWGFPVAVAVGLLALGVYGILMYSEAQSKQNFFTLMPLSKFGRPWLGGLQGFAVSNFAYSLGQKFRWFDAEEIAPLIESWQQLLNYKYNYQLQQ